MSATNASTSQQRRATPPPVVAQLESVFSSLPDSELVGMLTGPVRRGPRKHAAGVLWRCYVAKYVLGLPSTRALIRTLENNPFIAEACGVNDHGIPHEATFSRFFARLARRKYLHHLKDVSRELTRRCYATVPGFGERVSIDSTTLKAWSNGGKGRKADPDAGWSIKKGTNGSAKTFTYGWKLHLMVDCQTELPIAASVSAGNVHDIKRATYLLREARYSHTRFNPVYLMADAGYSSEPLRKVIRMQFGAVPVVQPNAGHLKRQTKWSGHLDPDEWKRLYAQRPAVERVFSRLKGQRSLNLITVRRRMKVTVHCYMALIALQASGLQRRGKGVIS